MSQTFEVLDGEIYAGAVVVKNVDAFGNETEMWLEGTTVNELVKAVIAQRLK